METLTSTANADCKTTMSRFSTGGAGGGGGKRRGGGAYLTPVRHDFLREKYGVRDPMLAGHSQLNLPVES